MINMLLGPDSHTVLLQTVTMLIFILMVISGSFYSLVLVPFLPHCLFLQTVHVWNQKKEKEKANRHIQLRTEIFLVGRPSSFDSFGSKLCI